MIPVWDIPHAFALIDIDATLLAHPIDVFTYGPIAEELATLSHPTPKRLLVLGRRLGFEWLASCVGTRSNVLAKYVRDRYSVQPGRAVNPFATVRGGELGLQPPERIPFDLVVRFCAEWQHDLKHIGQSINELVLPVRKVAGGAGWPRTDGAAMAAGRLAQIGSEFHLRRVMTRDGSRSEVVHEASNLYCRALTELEALYRQKPNLGVCARCNRTFVPSHGGQDTCRRFVWHSPSPSRSSRAVPRHTPRRHSSSSSPERDVDGTSGWRCKHVGRR